MNLPPEVIDEIAKWIKSYEDLSKFMMCSKSIYNVVCLKFKQFGLKPAPPSCVERWDKVVKNGLKPKTRLIASSIQYVTKDRVICFENQKDQKLMLNVYDFKMKLLKGFEVSPSSNAYQGGFWLYGATKPMKHPEIIYDNVTGLFVASVNGCKKGLAWWRIGDTIETGFVDAEKECRLISVCEGFALMADDSTDVIVVKLRTMTLERLRVMANANSKNIRAVKRKDGVYGFVLDVDQLIVINLERLTVTKRLSSTFNDYVMYCHPSRPQLDMVLLKHRKGLKLCSLITEKYFEICFEGETCDNLLSDLTFPDQHTIELDLYAYLQ